MKDILKSIYQPRDDNAKKYDFGITLVIGGSGFYSGAPALAGLAAFRAGSDMVRLIAPQRAADIIASFSPILAAYGLQGSSITKEHLSDLLVMTEAAKDVSHGNAAVVIGGGMGRSPEIQETIREYLAASSVPAVIDADGIYAFQGIAEEAAEGKSLVFTVHPYEFLILTGRNLMEASLEEKRAAVLEEAAKRNATILLKGHVDLISDGKEVLENTAGSPYMTVGGTGDVLAGLVTSYLARGAGPLYAAAAAAYVSGRAGEIAAKKFGESLVATDVIDAIPQAIS